MGFCWQIYGSQRNLIITTAASGRKSLGRLAGMIVPAILLVWICSNSRAICSKLGRLHRPWSFEICQSVACMGVECTKKLRQCRKRNWWLQTVKEEWEILAEMYLFAIIPEPYNKSNSIAWMPQLQRYMFLVFMQVSRTIYKPVLPIILAQSACATSGLSV